MRKFRRLLAVIFWLLVMQLLSIIFKDTLIFAGPLDIVRSLAALITQADFLLAVLATSWRILFGFILATVLAGLLAIAAMRSTAWEDFFAPLISVFKAVPVVSFILIILIYFGAASSSWIVVCIVTLPSLYESLLQGMRMSDPALVEMAEVFAVPFKRRLSKLYLPSAVSYFSAGASSAIGFAWKAGIATEVFGIVQCSLGERFYEAKIYLETADLFAYTAIIVMLSWLFSKILQACLRKMTQRYALGAQSAASQDRTADKVKGQEAAASSYYQTKLSESGAAVPASRATENKEAAYLQAVNITKRYGDVVALENFNYTFSDHSRSFVLGPSGCGKTTLLRLLLGLEEPSSGEILGRKTAKAGAVFQEARLLPHLTARENILFVAPHLPETEIQEAFVQLGLTGDLDKAVATFSGGMKDRVAIARLLLSDRYFLLMDEPFRSLDSETKVRTSAFIKRHLHGRPFILVSHQEEDGALMQIEEKILFRPNPDSSRQTLPRMT